MNEALFKEYLDKYRNHHAHSSVARDGVATIDEYISVCKEKNIDSLTITDHGSMGASLEQYYKCQEAGIKPILGQEVYYCLDTEHKFDIITDPKTGKPRKKPLRPFHLVLLAKNFKGYQSLVKLTNESQKHFYGKPRVDTKMLKKAIQEDGNNIICTTACMKSPLYPHPDHAYELSNIFKDDFFLELQYHGWNTEKEKAYIDQLISYSKRDGMRLTITNDSHIAREDDIILHRLLTAVDRKININDPGAAYMSGRGYHSINGSELWDICKDQIDQEIFFEALKNVDEITNKCNLVLPYKKGEFVFPEFNTPIGFDNNFDYLKHLCFTSSRYISDKHSERLLYELKVYKDCGFVDYILPLQEIVIIARNNDIEVGPGRGSGAGSLVNYLLYVTNLDPFDYDLSFERFITAKFNSETGLYENARQSAPDIDVDFDLPQKVFELVRQKHGKDRVCGISTQLLYGPKSAMRDTLRAFQYDPQIINHYSKFITEDMNSLNDIMSDLPAELKEIEPLLRLAVRLEGRVSTTSRHAAGVVFSNQLQSHIPLVIDKTQLAKGAAAEFASVNNIQASVDGENEFVEDEDAVVYLSQYDMDSIKHTGFTKYDLLGISTLKVLKMCKELTGIHWLDLNPRAIEHKEVYEYIFQNGNTAGIFQFSSPGMRGVLRDMKAECFEDIQACNALFRPQTLVQGLHTAYITNKFSGWEAAKDIHGNEHPIVRQILDETHGVPVYQEQVLKFLTLLGNLDSYDADTFRKILSDNKTNTDPKQLAKLKQYKDEFIQGAILNNMSEEEAIKIYDDLASKSGYSFNKSHSCAYAFIGFALAYYKFHYPFEFIVSTINDKPEILLDLLNDLADSKISSKDIRIKFPDLNLSSLNPTVEKDEKGKFIQLGLTNIYGLGEAVCQDIIDNRPYEMKSMINVKKFLDDNEAVKKYTEQLDAFKQQNPNLESRAAGKLFASENGPKPKSDREDLGALNKCSSRKLTSKSILMLLEAGSFSHIPRTSPIFDYKVYLPSIQDQIKHFGFIIDVEEELAKEFKKWHTLIDKTITNDTTGAVAGYILSIQPKLTVNKKPYFTIKLYNPVLKISLGLNCWENSFTTKKNRFTSKTEYGFKDKGFTIGDGVVFKVKAQASGFITYVSGHYIKDLKGL